MQTDSGVLASHISALTKPARFFQRTLYSLNCLRTNLDNNEHIILQAWPHIVDALRREVHVDLHLSALELFAELSRRGWITDSESELLLSTIEEVCPKNQEKMVMQFWATFRTEETKAPRVREVLIRMLKNLKDQDILSQILSEFGEELSIDSLISVQRKALDHLQATLSYFSALLGSSPIPKETKVQVTDFILAAVSTYDDPVLPYYISAVLLNEKDIVLPEYLNKFCSHLFTCWKPILFPSEKGYLYSDSSNLRMFPDDHELPRMLQQGSIQVNLQYNWYNQFTKNAGIWAKSVSLAPSQLSKEWPPHNLGEMLREISAAEDQCSVSQAAQILEFVIVNSCWSVLRRAEGVVKKAGRRKGIGWLEVASRIDNEQWEPELGNYLKKILASRELSLKIKVYLSYKVGLKFGICRFFEAISAFASLSLNLSRTQPEKKTMSPNSSTVTLRIESNSELIFLEEVCQSLRRLRQIHSDRQRPENNLGNTEIEFSQIINICLFVISNSHFTDKQRSFAIRLMFYLTDYGIIFPSPFDCYRCILDGLSNHPRGNSNFTLDYLELFEAVLENQIQLRSRENEFTLNSEMDEEKSEYREVKKGLQESILKSKNALIEN